MKFYGQPNQVVREKKEIKMTGATIYKSLFRFNENGEYETSDEKMIDKLKKRFRYEESQQGRHCKKCDFVAETQGLLLKHYREEHKRGE